MTRLKLQHSCRVDTAISDAFLLKNKENNGTRVPSNVVSPRLKIISKFVAHTLALSKVITRIALVILQAKQK